MLSLKMLKRIMLWHCITCICVTSIDAQQRVGIGTLTPVAKLDLLGAGNFPTMPGNTSTGVLRIGIDSIEGIDIGKMGNFPYAGWIQTGYNGLFADPLILQPLGGTVSIGTGNASPASSAVLELKSTTKGLLPPRLTYAQRNNIQNPEAGLLLYCTDCSYNGQLQVYNGSYWESMMGTPGDDLPAVGDPAGDGIIFYIFQPGDPGYVAGETHGLITGSSFFPIHWGCFGIDIPGAEGTAFGTGLQNTIDIVEGCNDPFAAEWCYTGTGFLPSKDELLLLKNSSYFPGLGGCVPPFYNCKFWTSSEIDANTVWALDLVSNTMVAEPKNNFDGNVIPFYSF